MSYQKNMILESAKKLELSVNEATNSTYQIRQKKYLKDSVTINVQSQAYIMNYWIKF